MSWSFVSYDSKYIKENFDCGKPVLNNYLKTKMSQDMKRKANVPTLAINDRNEVVGYYTLSAGEVQFENFPAELKKKIAPYPVSVARLGRLAVDQSMHGKGLGADLLAHAIRKTEGVSQEIGMRALVVDAKDEDAESFYKHFGFDYLLTNSSRKSLFLL
ncbi:MAG: GNAT family N-acetyltransferase [Bdellovibrio sp.]|nr:GNAT family N-acetyltransferase [Bdellovibrio sp.]